MTTTHGKAATEAAARARGERDRVAGGRVEDAVLEPALRAEDREPGVGRDVVHEQTDDLIAFGDGVPEDLRVDRDFCTGQLTPTSRLRAFAENSRHGLSDAQALVDDRVEVGQVELGERGRRVAEVRGELGTQTALDVGMPSEVLDDPGESGRRGLGALSAQRTEGVATARAAMRKRRASSTSAASLRCSVPPLLARDCKLSSRDAESNARSSCPGTSAPSQLTVRRTTTLSGDPAKALVAAKSRLAVEMRD